MMRQNIGLIAALTVASTVRTVGAHGRDEDELLDEIERSPDRKVRVAVPRPVATVAPAKVHKHEREIARRLRQEARRAAQHPEHMLAPKESRDV